MWIFEFWQADETGLICVDLSGSSTIIVGSILWIMLLNSGRAWCPNGSQRRHVRGQGSADRHSLPWTSGGVSDDEEHPGVPWKGILEVLLGALGNVYLEVAWWEVPLNTCKLPVWMMRSTLTLKKIEVEIEICKSFCTETASCWWPQFYKWKTISLFYVLFILKLYRWWLVDDFPVLLRICL